MTHSSNGTDTLASRGREGSSSTVMIPRGRIAGIGGCAEVPGHRLAGEIGVQFHQPQVAIGRAMRTPEVSGDDADQAAGVVGQGRGLDRPESGGGGDLTVRREARVGSGVGHDGLRAPLCRPSAHGLAIPVDDGEVLQELRSEAGLGDEH
jgi:hypothetical protein